MEFFTIGVYNSTEKEFFEKLTNSNRLQQKLSELEIKYGYVPELAPTSEIRGLQKEIDLEKGELKRERHELGKVFVIEYKNKILKNFDFETFIDKLDQVGASRVVFFCVEEFPEACHRSIVTDRLKDKYNYKVTHL
jgi:uncharacterized protein (DUF488 family)